MSLLKGRLKFDKKTERPEKTPQILKDLLEELIFPLTREFIKFCAKFDGFYTKNLIFSPSINQAFNPSEIEEFFSKLIKQSDLSGFDIYYKHEEFFNPDFPNLSHTTEISFKFQTYSYLITIRELNTLKAIEFDRSYSEVILPDELYAALNEIAKSHKNFIEEKTKLT